MVHRPVNSDVAARNVPATVRLRPNHKKALEAVLYLIREGGARGVSMTQYVILKSIFLADRTHLNTYGRPVTFDNYAAMKDGPVASFVYDLLKENRGALHVLGLERPEWTREAAPHISKSAMIYSGPRRAPEMGILSPSDVEALSSALTVVSSLTFTQIRKLTHEDPAYVAAWRDDGGRKAYDMSYALLFDTPDYESAVDLAFASEHS